MNRSAIVTNIVMCCRMRISRASEMAGAYDCASARPDKKQ